MYLVDRRSSRLRFGVFLGPRRRLLRLPGIAIWEIFEFLGWHQIRSTSKSRWLPFYQIGVPSHPCQFFPFLLGEPHKAFLLD